ncbi:hypothetical protein KR222_004956 [Zaprionus bogoriensis]|nr:hypothetical protein KR222_004956 [Zaprionus bogoriensis]
MSVPGSATILTLLAVISLQELLLLQAAPAIENAVYSSLDLLADESAPEHSALAPQLRRQRRYGHDFSGEGCHHRHHGRHGPHRHGPPGGYGFGFDEWHGQHPPPPPPPYGFGFEGPFDGEARHHPHGPQYKAPLAPFEGAFAVSVDEGPWPNLFLLAADGQQPSEQPRQTPNVPSTQPAAATPTTTTTSTTSTSTSTTTSTTTITEDTALGIDLRIGTD